MDTMERLDEVLARVRAEVARACAKHPAMNSPHEGHSVIREELDELWDHVKADTGRTNDAFKEAVQIACTAVRYCVDLRPADLERERPSVTIGGDSHYDHDHAG